jgi:hypothetical protein
MLLVVNFIYIYIYINKVDKYLENLLFNNLGVPKSKQSVSQKEIMLCFTSNSTCTLMLSFFRCKMISAFYSVW